MKIVVNDIAAQTGGALSVLKSFYEFVRDYDNENTYVFLLSEPLVEETERIRVITVPKVKKSWLHKLWFDNVAGKRLINGLSPDYVLSLQNTITAGVKAPQGVYIHQSIPFQTKKKFSPFKSAERMLFVYQYLIGAVIKRSARRACRVFVQTEWMKKAVSEMARVQADRVSVIPVPTMPLPSADDAVFSPNRFFFPCGFEAVYKNHTVIYDACRLLAEEGCFSPGVVLTLPQPSVPPAPFLSYCGFLDKPRLAAAYRSGTLLFPSYIETVGLPLKESMSLSGTIVCADCEYAHEALGSYDRVIYFDPFDARSLADAMRQVMTGRLCPGSTSSPDPSAGTGTNAGWRKMLDEIICRR